ncbi:hypothetical protein JTE92_18430 [Cupriavidus oxalaticus]|uniref:Uncharacterized protein n=1 Tax=Cupriavidus oxalaticus TaxID=96344 RepID=A0ABX7I088_9BURK|nr:hypothetical protein [Cupriavidus oxalaticus]QRQ89216.1 hypothetical protein JTE91_23830 [Cupriavidus oxalaticus]QRQ96004.1 hypothetical protein JTE92_18430 [Cupriavidus oxalaticus]
MRNPYKVLRDLMPDPPLQVGTVVSITGSVASIQLPGGGVAQARGEAAVNDRVFFRDGVIEGPAPTLPIVLIDV